MLPCILEDLADHMESQPWLIIQNRGHMGSRYGLSCKSDAWQMSHSDGFVPQMAV